jgi:hypothetical protein
MATTRAYWKPRSVVHDVLAGEITSGYVRVPMVGTAPGTGESTPDCAFVGKVENSGTIKSDFLMTYNPNSGTVDVQNGVDSLQANDTITIIGMFYN